MNKFFNMLQVIFIGVLVTAFVFFIILQYQKSVIYDESKTFVYKVAPEILKDMDKNTLLKYTDTHQRNSTLSEDIDKMFVEYKKLGGLRDFAINNGWANISFNKSGKTYISATSKAVASFDTGDIDLSITSVKDEDGWRILVFNVN